MENEFGITDKNGVGYSQAQAQSRSTRSRWPSRFHNLGTQFSRSTAYEKPVEGTMRDGPTKVLNRAKLKLGLELSLPIYLYILYILVRVSRRWRCLTLGALLQALKQVSLVSPQRAPVPALGKPPYLLHTPRSRGPVFSRPTAETVQAIAS